MTDPARRPTAVPWLVLIGFLAVFAVNALSSTGAIAGTTPGQLSDGIPNLFVPAGLTFSIWGAIYLALAAFCVFAFQRPAAAGRVATPFLLSCAANVGWILLWHHRLVGLSLLAMLVLLGSLLWADRLLDPTGRAAAPDRRTYWMAVVPFRIYLGWIAVATIANATAWLVTIRWDGFGIAESTWTVVLVAVAGALAVARLVLSRDTSFAAVVLWAVAGILLRHATTLGAAHPDVVGTCIAVAVLLLAGVVLGFAANVRRGSRAKATAPSGPEGAP